MPRPGPDDEPAAVDLDVLAAAVDEARAELAVASAAAEQLVAELAAETSLVPTAAIDTAVQVKAAFAEKRVALIRVQQDVLAKQRKMQAAIREQEAALEEQMAQMAAALEPLQKQVDRLQEGIWSVNLYLGRDEEIVPLRDGAPAPAGTPITVRQQVLRMDEESQLKIRDGGLDIRDLAAFDEWLLADPAHLDQLLPEPRGVVALTPRGRNEKRYSSEFEQAHMDNANHKATYFLLRNGDRLFRLTTEFEVGARLVPRADEFTAFFSRRRKPWERGVDDRIPLEPGSSEWVEAEESADARQRHFMRVGMILQGLLDRTTVFHPLPVPNLSILQPAAYLAGHIVMLADEENVLGTGREPLRDWQRRLNSQLQVGMRIVGHFGYGWAGGGEDERLRIHPKHASNPPDGVLHRIERVEHGEFVILYKRTDKVWAEVPVPGRPGYVRDALVEPKRRASARLSPTDEFLIPFDLVTVEEMQGYLDDRTERRHYLNVLPLLRAAIALKREEEATEEPFRAALRGALVRDAGIAEEEAPRLADELIHWWKLGHKWHRPLNGEPEHEAKAARMIVAEAKRRAKAERGGDEDKAVAALRLVHPEAMYVARKNDGTYVVYEPQPQRYPHRYRPANVYVTVHEHKGSKAATRQWALPSRAHARWRILFSDDRWAKWNKISRPGEQPTDPDVEAMLAAAKAQIPDGYAYVGAAFGRGDYGGGSFQVRAYGLDLTEPADTPLPYSEPVAQHLPTVTVKAYYRGLNPVQTNVDLPRRSGSSWFDRDAGYGNWGYHASDVDEEGPWVGSGCDRIDAVDSELKRARALMVRRREINAPGVVIRRHAEAAVASVTAQWVAQWETEQRARFDDDFGDPEMWAAHLQTLRRPRPPATGDLAVIIARLLERGVEVEGRTVAELLRRYELENVVEPIDYEGDIRGGVLVPGTATRAEPPAPPHESLHAFAVVAASTPEDDEDDEDDEPTYTIQPPAGPDEAVPSPAVEVTTADGTILAGELLDADD